MDETTHLYHCLARKILTYPLAKRRVFLNGFQKKHGEEVTDRLKLYVVNEFNKQKESRNETRTS